MEGLSGTKRSRALLLSSLAALVSTSVCAAVSFKALKESLFSEQVSFNLKDEISEKHLWWSDAKLGFQSSDAPEPYAIAALEFKHEILLQKSKPLKPRVSKISQAITLKQSAPQRVIPVASAQIFAATEASEPEVFSPPVAVEPQIDYQELLDLHRVLRQNRENAKKVDSQIELQMDIQVTDAQIVAYKKYVEATSAMGALSSLSIQPKAQPKVEVPRKEPIKVVREEIIYPKVDPLPGPLSDEISEDSRLGLYQAASAQEVQVISVAQAPSTTSSVTSTFRLPSEPEKKTYVLAPTGPEEQTQSPVKIAKIKPTLAPTGPEQLTDAIKSSQSKQAEPIDNGLTNLSEDSAEDSPPYIPDPAPILPVGCASPKRDLVQLGADIFDQDQIVSIHSDEVTHQMGGLDSRWVRAKTPKYYPSVEYRRTWICGREAPVPMMSTNSAQILGLLTKTQIQSSLGMIVGRVPSGYKVEISGRSEPVAYFETQNGKVLGKLLSPDQTESERVFVSLNVSPGSHLVYLQGELKGAVAVPAFEGAATFVDLRSPKTQAVSGGLYKAEAIKKTGAAGVWVNVVGQNKSSKTNSSGSFTISNVVTIGNFPIYLDTRSENSYSHRYFANPAALSGLVYFFFASKTVGDILSQLEGGVHPESAIVLSSVNGLVSEPQYDGSIFARINTFNQNSSIIPQTYTLDQRNRSLVGEALSRQNPRYLGVQIPEGSNLVEIEDRDQRPVWSEIFFASPGVINVLPSL